MVHLMAYLMGLMMDSSLNQSLETLMEHLMACLKAQSLDLPTEDQKDKMKEKWKVSKMVLLLDFDC